MLKTLHVVSTRRLAYLMGKPQLDRRISGFPVGLVLCARSLHQTIKVNNDQQTFEVQYVDLLHTREFRHDSHKRTPQRKSRK